MNDATKQALNDFVQRIISAANSAADFTSAQVPLLVQEWLQWQFWDAAGTALFWTLVLTTTWFVALYYMPKVVYKLNLDPEHAHSAKYAKEYQGAAKLVGMALATMLTVPMILEISHHGLLAIKVWVAPRVVILEKFADLVR